MTIAFHASAISIRKKPIELDAFEASKLLDYKLYQLNLEEFFKRV